MTEFFTIPFENLKKQKYKAMFLLVFLALNSSEKLRFVLSLRESNYSAM